MLRVGLFVVLALGLLLQDRGSRAIPAPLLPYGPGLDTCFDGFDDSRTPIPFPTPFLFFGVPYTEIDIISNGIISFNTSLFSTYFFPVDLQSTMEPMVAVLNDDLKDYGTGIYYRTSFDPADLALVGLYISQLYPVLDPTPSPLYAVIVTWNRINFFSVPEQDSLFQAVLTFSTSTNHHYVLMLYGDVDFTLRQPGATIGVTDGGAYRLELCASNSTDSLDVDIKTQAPTACPGVWGFLVDPAGAPPPPPPFCVPSLDSVTSCSPANNLVIGGCGSTLPPPTMPPTPPPPPTQDDRVFGTICANCIVSHGLGYTHDFEDCSCFYTCILGAQTKTGRDWIAHKRCCPCHQTFSRKLLTCVDYTDKNSDCFNPVRSNNPCDSVSDNTWIARSNPSIAAEGSVLCSGYHDCEQVGSVVVPHPKCCPDGQCFSAGAGTCEVNHCSSGFCNTLVDTDDCRCEDTPMPVSECAFVPGDSQFNFMGVENMKTYQCAPGTCWDQDLCTCVRVNNTGYDDCVPFAHLDFDNDFTARDRRGSTIYTEVKDVSRNGGDAEFDGSGGTVNVAGLANTYLSNDFVLRFDFTLTEDDASSQDTDQCIMGNCKQIFSVEPEETNTLSVTVERAEDGNGYEMQVLLTWQDKDFMSSPDSMEQMKFEFGGEFLIDSQYEFWLIYFGSEETMITGVLDSSEAFVGGTFATVTNSKQLIHTQSGFIFGDCLDSQPFEGTLDNIEMWRRCQPFDNAEFETAFNEIYF